MKVISYVVEFLNSNEHPLAKVINYVIHQLLNSIPLVKDIRLAYEYHSANQSPHEKDHLEQFLSRLMEWLGVG